MRNHASAARGFLRPACGFLVSESESIHSVKDSLKEARFHFYNHREVLIHTGLRLFHDVSVLRSPTLLK